MEDKLIRLSKESFLAELELTEQQKRAMIHEVKNQPTSNAKSNFAWYKASLSFIICAVLLIGIGSVAFQSIQNPDYHGAEKTVLTKVEGMDFAHSEYFKMVDWLDQRKKGTFYKPLPIEKMMSVLPDSMKSAANPIDSDSLPFEVNEENAYLVRSKTKEGKVQNEVQFTYLNKSTNGFANEFYVMSITEVAENPLNMYDFSKEKTDTMGNDLRREILKDDIPIYHQVRTTDSALVYTYYGYDAEEEKVFTIGTAANELYTYYNGYVYHVGYLVNGGKSNGEVQAKMLQLTRDFILGKSRAKRE